MTKKRYTRKKARGRRNVSPVQPRGLVLIITRFENHDYTLQALKDRTQAQGKPEIIHAVELEKITRKKIRARYDELARYGRCFLLDLTYSYQPQQVTPGDLKEIWR